MGRFNKLYITCTLIQLQDHFISELLIIFNLLGNHSISLLCMKYKNFHNLLQYKVKVNIVFMA